MVKGVDLSYPFERLASEPGRVGRYTGVRNGQAKNTLRDRMAAGDLAFFYHSSCKVPGIAGIVEITRAAIPDDDALDARHPLYDARHTRAAPRWFCCDVKEVRPLCPYLPLPLLRAHAAALGDMTLLRQPRLSVQPVTAAQWAAVLSIEAAAAGAAAGGAAGASLPSPPSSAPAAKRARGSAAAAAPAAAAAAVAAAADSSTASKPLAAAPPAAAGTKRRRGAA